MFTGIIEATGKVEKITRNESNIDFVLSCPFTHDLKIDQSLAHNGCCLTVVEIENDTYRVTAIAETLEKTNLGQWIEGTEVNLERCLKFDGRLDGRVFFDIHCLDFKKINLLVLWILFLNDLQLILQKIQPCPGFITLLRLFDPKLHTP